MEYKDINLIDAYWKGNLTEKEQKEVEKRATEEAAFKALLEQQELIKKGVRVSKTQDLLKMVQSFEEEAKAIPIMPIKKDTSSNIWRWIALAASLLLLIGAGLWWQNNNSNAPQIASNNDFLAEYFKPYPCHLIKRSGKKNIKAYQAYNANQFDKAIQYFSETTDSTARKEDFFYLGNAQLATGNYDLAIVAFNNYLSIDSTYINQTRFYKGLAYLKKEDYGNARSIFCELKYEKHSYAKKSEIILQNMGDLLGDCI